jgi:hypothetical protein
MAGGAYSCVALLLTGLLAACSPGPETIPLAYEPAGPVPVFPSRPLVAVGQVLDARGASPDWLGTTAGTAGFPEQALVSEPPAQRAVRDAFVTALMARGLFSPPADKPRFDLSVRIVRLDGGENWRRRAAADFVVTLADRATGRIVYTDEVRNSATDAGPFSLDSAAYVPAADLAELTQRTLNQAIAQALDKPGFLAALRS